MSTTESDVLIVGAGIVGLCAAHFGSAGSQLAVMHGAADQVVKDHDAQKHGTCDGCL